MNQARILLAEDDPNLGALLQEYLQLKGFTVSLCADGESGWQTYQQDRYDLCILDVMLPRRDGFTLARSIRKRDAAVPLIFLTAKSMKEDKIEGFTIGADDYITKPFSIEELLLRIQAILRRTRTGEPDTSPPAASYAIGSYTFDVEHRLLAQNGCEHHVSAKEAQLLALLCAHLNDIVKRETALKEIWGEDSYFNARSMDVYITKLRKHLKDDPAVKIVNVHGIGYKLVVES